jgi:hypothetical protein
MQCFITAERDGYVTERDGDGVPGSRDYP